YCYENTNAAGNLFTSSNGQNLVYDNRVTHVVLKTRICDVNGKTLPMVSFRGTLFHEKAFLAYVARILRNGTNKLNYYYKTSETETTASYLQVSQDNFELAPLNGKFDKAVINLKGLEGKKLYAKSINEEGKEVYTEIKNGLTLLAGDVAEVYNNSTSANAIYWYKDGANTYFIPVEHNAGSGRTLADEGYYGVVRNHWYELSINSFSRVGHALNDPDSGTTEIKPDEPEDPLYYVGAEINILSWRIISQGVDL
ncbi:MAG: Mfa1 fimbrilin C-terminal domain-containing protein, partial [Muribaculaceae bacterium]|nr:Mfa1 fimbrilin C-terminal domain-containing protein [Muribaculaceae bacterium]